jgi:hypothetical protein
MFASRLLAVCFSNKHASVGDKIASHRIGVDKSSSHQMFALTAHPSERLRVQTDALSRRLLSESIGQFHLCP